MPAANPAFEALCGQELFFEYHFHEPHWSFGWPTSPLRYRHSAETGESTSQTAGAKPLTVDDALALMQKLRRMGIRAHFWV